jgi:hypothetical protein
MRYEIVDKIQTFKDYIDGKVDNEDIAAVDLKQGEVWEMSCLSVPDVQNEEIIFTKKYTK